MVPQSEGRGRRFVYECQPETAVQPWRKKKAQVAEPRLQRSPPNAALASVPSAHPEWSLSQPSPSSDHERSTECVVLSFEREALRAVASLNPLCWGSPRTAQKQRNESTTLRGRVVNEAICFRTQSPNDGQIWVWERRCNFELFMPAQMPSSLSAANHRPRRPPPFRMRGRGGMRPSPALGNSRTPSCPGSTDQPNRCADRYPMRSGPDQVHARGLSRCGRRSRCSAAPSNCDPSFTPRLAARCRRLSRLLGRQLFK
ncbi:hypothetical protein B0T14DRAFT_143028 [Immersiella caudata]|uniref:Uncharacterized protein n=1 Tax=Immersiella caudata TaxID=314043 RepID=A0AA39X6I6_9PEZI|nr:hypothetical protein B0T14DRAFT_143028 [Immersiella caudata]